MPTFPTLSTGQDSAQYTVTMEDPAIKSEMEGGYMVSRARHTRTPRRTYTTGFTFIDSTDKALIDAFWDTVKGGSNYFDWTDPATNTVKSVRFKDEIKYKYVGRGDNQRWNVVITLEEV